MIRLTLMCVEPTISTLRELWDDAMPALIGELREAGYTVDEDNRYEAVRDDGWELRHAIEPDSGILVGTAFDLEGGLIWISLHGDRFHAQGYDRPMDAAMWDRIEAVGQRLAVAHRVIHDVGDPDSVTGAPGSPGTFIPPNLLPDDEDEDG
jgi:hypothetical protein